MNVAVHKVSALMTTKSPALECPSMASGHCGMAGEAAVLLVVEDSRPGTDSATIHCHSLVVVNVLVQTQRLAHVEMSTVQLH